MSLIDLHEPLLLALLALGDKMHLLTIGLRDALRHHTLVETAQQLFDCLAVASLYLHTFA